MAAQEAGVELIGMTVQIDLPKLGLTGEAIVTDIQACPNIEAKAGSGHDRRVVTATFHHSSGATPTGAAKTTGATHVAHFHSDVSQRPAEKSLSCETMLIWCWRTVRPFCRKGL